MTDDRNYAAKYRVQKQRDDQVRENVHEIEERQRAALAQTLHSINTGTKYCLACASPRPAAQYKCACGKIATRRR